MVPEDTVVPPFDAKWVLEAWAPKVVEQLIEVCRCCTTRMHTVFCNGDVALRAAGANVLFVSACVSIVLCVYV